MSTPKSCDGMLIDDKKGSLATLYTKVKSSNKVRKKDDFNVGDIIFQRMDTNDGLTLNDGYNTRNKYFVIVGKNTKGDAIGVCLINSNLEYHIDNPIMQKYQYTLYQKDYPSILTKDSRLDCAVLFPMRTRKSIAVKAEKVGHLTESDKNAIMPLLASCPFINEHMRRLYQIQQVHK